jgi:two-component system heavy metal sensor histidine kinase CusS
MSSKNAPEATRAAAAWSLAARLTAWYAGSAFVLILAATGFLYWVLVTNLEREDDQFLLDKVRFLRELLAEKGEKDPAFVQEAEWESGANQHVQYYLRILDEQGRSIIETPHMSSLLPPDSFPEAGSQELEPGSGSELVSSSGTSYRVLAAKAVSGPAGGTRRVIQVALDRTQEEALLTGYRRSLWLVLAMALLACAVAGYQIANRGFRPVREMAHTVRRIRSSTLHERIETPGLPAELLLLAGQFNEMMDRLQEAFQRLSQFSANIAHELRTPVNNLRGQTEVALAKSRSPEEYREVLGSCLEECGRLSNLIDSLLFLARADSTKTPIARERVDVWRELETVREFYEPSAAEAGVVLVVSCRPGLSTELDRTLFQRAIANLVANALAHTTAGGSIHLAATEEPGGIRVVISDSGEGIPPEHLPHVFDRFYRVDTARTTVSGRVGLGLAIVKSIATLHGATVDIASELGEGTQVTIVFPHQRAENNATHAP